MLTCVFTQLEEDLIESVKSAQSPVCIQARYFQTSIDLVLFPNKNIVVCMLWYSLKSYVNFEEEKNANFVFDLSIWAAAFYINTV